MTTYYVSTSGADDGDGGAGSPWRTINHAMQQDLRPGDEVVVAPGTYREAVVIPEGGSAAGQVTLRSEVPGEALIRAPSDSPHAIDIGASHVTVDGFDVQGAGGGHGIKGNAVHHVEVLNNVSHDNGQSGISFAYSDFITIEGNVTHDNASNGWFSGISIWQNRNITGDTNTEEFRTIVRDNVSYDNVTGAGDDLIGGHSDGNGIIIDDFQNTQNEFWADPTEDVPNYTYPTLVENNLVHGNGGKGIQVFLSDGVTVRGNTAHHNNQDGLNEGTWRGELSNSLANGNTWVNNVAVTDPSSNPENRAIDNTSFNGLVNEDVVWRNNITFDGTPGEASVKTDGGNAAPSAEDGNLLGVDPRLNDPGASDFTLAPGSPAIDAGTGAFGHAPQDLEGGKRAVGAVDMGAYEHGGGEPAEPAPEPAAPTPAPEPITEPIEVDADRAGIEVRIVDADADVSRGTLEDGGAIAEGQVDLDAINFEAVVPGGDARSVTFSIDGGPEMVQNVAPYAAFRNQGDDFAEGSIGPGPHTIVVEAHSERDGGGETIASETISFTAEGGGGGEGGGDGSDLLDFSFVDAGTNARIGGLEDGDRVDAGDLGPTTSIAATAEGSPEDIGRVRLSLDGRTQDEVLEPYALFGDREGDFFGGREFAPGRHELGVEVFDASDQLVEATTLTFEVV